MAGFEAFELIKEMGHLPKPERIPSAVEHLFAKPAVEYTKKQLTNDLLIINTFETNPTIGRDELLKMLPVQEHQKAELFLNRRDKIAELVQEFQTPEELYQHLFGFKPTGEIQMASGALSVNFICFEQEDFYQVRDRTHEGIARPNTNVTMRGMLVRKCDDSRADYAVTVCKSNDDLEQALSIDATENEIEHEKMHVIKHLLEDKQTREITETLAEPSEMAKSLHGLPPQEFETQLKDYLVSCRELLFEIHEKDEIAAYLAQGMSTENIANMLTTDYYHAGETFNELIKQGLASGLDEGEIFYMKGVSDRVFGDYAMATVELLKVSQDLLNKGYSNKEVALILANTHARQLI